MTFKIYGILLAMQIKISPLQIQKQILAPSMRQSIEVLLLPITELQAAIDQELQENPLLEIDEEKAVLEQSPLNEIINKSLQQISEAASFRDGDFSRDEEFHEKPISNVKVLEEYLLEQLRFEVSSPLEQRIGEFIVGNLNEDGYLTCGCEEIAQTLHTDPVTVERVLSVIQNFDPLGIASRDLKECLCVQTLTRFGADAGLMTRIVGEHFDELARKRYHEIAQRLRIPVEKVKDLARSIAGLEPKPARNYRPIRSSIYIQPDAFILKDQERGYYVEVSREGVPAFRVNAYYRNLLARPELSAKDREFIQEKFRNATNFIKSIEQRGHTLRRIAEYILIKQMGFWDRGEDLVPMILKDVARAIDRNESTISRAISNKYIDTPRGLFPLKFFFSQGIPSTDDGNGGVVSRSVKDEIQAIIDSEDKTSPLSDQEIYHYLSQRNMPVARRTISKYRQALRILPSNLRKV